MYRPGAKLARVVDAAGEPLALADALNYLRLPPTFDNPLVSDMITAARLECERIGGRSYITTTWSLTLDAVPFLSTGPLGLWGSTYVGQVIGDDGGITLPMPPLLALQSFQYIDQGGTARSLDVSPGNPNVIVSGGVPGVIYPAFGTFFPLTQPRPASTVITYTAGYGPDSDSVPANIRMAMRLLVATYYVKRTTDYPAPDAVVNLIRSTEGPGYA